ECASAMACASASDACSAAYWARPCDNSDDHCCTWASWAALIRVAVMPLSVDVRSNERSCVTAAVDEDAGGGSRCGRITAASTTVQTTTARRSGTNPLTLLSLKSPYPGALFRPERGAKTSGGTAQ